MGPILHMSKEMTNGRNSYKCTASNKGPNGQPATAERTIKFDVTLDIGVSGKSPTKSYSNYFVFSWILHTYK